MSWDNINIRGWRYVNSYAETTVTLSHIRGETFVIRPSQALVHTLTDYIRRNSRENCIRVLNSKLFVAECKLDNSAKRAKNHSNSLCIPCTFSRLHRWYLSHPRIRSRVPTDSTRDKPGVRAPVPGHLYCSTLVIGVRYISRISGRTQAG